MITYRQLNACNFSLDRFLFKMPQSIVTSPHIYSIRPFCKNRGLNGGLIANAVKCVMKEARVINDEAFLVSSDQMLAKLMYCHLLFIQNISLFLIG